MAASSITIKEQYDRIVGKLESMAIDTALLDQRPDDAIFIDDMLLRLKLWSADIQYDQGSLEWAESLVQVSVPLRERLQQLDQQCLLFDAVSKQVSAKGQDHQTSEDPAKNSREASNNDRDAAKRSLRLSVDDLVAFATPIKIAASVPKEHRTEETVSQVNQDVRKTFQPRPSKKSPYILLRKALPTYLVERLLGAVIVPEELLEVDISSGMPLRIPAIAAKVRVAQSTMESFSTDTQTVRSNQFLLGTSTSPALFGTTAVKVWQLVEAEEYFEFFIKEHLDDLEFLFALEPEAHVVLVSVLLTAQLSGKQDSTLPTSTVEHAESESEQIFAFGCLEISSSHFGRPKLNRKPGGLIPTYHLPPTFTLAPPPVGPLALGSILIDLRHVDPINADSLVEIPTHQMPVYRHHTSGFQSTTSGMGAGEYGIWSKVLSIAGLGGKTGSLSQRAEEGTFKFDRLETIYFIPTEDYIRQSVEQGSVLDYIKASGYKPVYLVIGLKIARGPALIQARKTPIGHKAQLELSLPDSMGATTTRLEGNTQTTVFEGSSDFIVGIKFKKIVYKRKFLGRKRELSEENFNKGAELL